MYFCHGHKTSGHFGKNRSKERLRRRYFWPGMSSDIIRWISTCPDCCRNKPGPGMGKSPLSQELFGVRFARVAVDIISGFKTTPDGNTCMMVVTDYYTKYTRVFPLKDHTAATCAAAFVKGWVLHLGVPLMLHSDQGREFESNLWQEMCNYLAICKTRTNPYRPQSDGGVERFNRTLIQVLKPLVNEEMDDWDEFVEFVVHAYNGTVHASTNCSPNLLVYGEDIIMPADLVFGVVGISPELPCHVMFVEALRERFKNAYEWVRIELQKNAKWQKVGYDTKLKHRVFKVGDRVLRLHQPLAKLKLAANWDGPFTVAQIISESTVIIQSVDGKLKKSNVARLRIWKGREVDEASTEKGIMEIITENVKRIDNDVPKRGPGRPRKVKIVNPQKCGGEAKVSPSVVPKKKKGKILTKLTPETILGRNRLNENESKPLRRSPRLLVRTAVT